MDNSLLKGNGEVGSRFFLREPLFVKYGKHLEELVLKHKWCFPNYTEGQASFVEPSAEGKERHEGYIVDGWGCKWHMLTYWDVGQIEAHPLSDTSKLLEYCPPDPSYIDELGNRLDWESYDKGLIDFDPGLRIFERTHFLMGMENMMIALAEGDPMVEKIIGMIIQRNMVAIDRMLARRKLPRIIFQDDLGDQKSLLISPALWRRYFKPGYRAMFSACRYAGVPTFLHSDGQISEIFDDFVEIGLSILNCQVSVIGIDRVAECLKGRMYISADIDRQNILPFGTPNDVKELVREIVMKLGSPTGGLELSADIYPDTPLENIAAFLDAAEEYRMYWVGRNL